MADSFVSRGFFGKRRQEAGSTGRVPPGQYVTEDFPVLSAGPTPHKPLDQWTFTIEGLVKRTVQWNWEEFISLPSQVFQVDIHCVTKWSKLDTQWEGISLDTLDVLNGRAFVAYRYEGLQLAPEHGGPARLVVPHLYFWKSAKWVRGLRLMQSDKAGFWESLGYNNRGDPWKEERYWGD
jgi:DMSO/TMAO reductase YedYZ molybdopterin-dependent catalytic subunit